MHFIALRMFYYYLKLFHQECSENEIRTFSIFQKNIQTVFPIQMSNDMAIEVAHLTRRSLTYLV